MLPGFLPDPVAGGLLRVGPAAVPSGVRRRASSGVQRNGLLSLAAKQGLTHLASRALGFDCDWRSTIRDAAS